MARNHHKIQRAQITVHDSKMVLVLIYNYFGEPRIMALLIPSIQALIFGGRYEHYAVSDPLGPLSGIIISLWRATRHLDATQHGQHTPIAA